MIKRQVCWVIGCDKCGTDMYDDGGNWGGTPHYETEAEALEQIKPCDDACSPVELHRRGDQVLCTRHAHETDCEREGHRWGKWLTPYADQQWRICDHCGDTEERRADGTR